MRTRFLLVLVLIGLTVAAGAQGQPARGRRPRNYPPQLENATVKVYKTVGDTKFNLYVFKPEKHRADDRRPAIVFFFGGGWRSGSPKQFETHCEYLAGRGMVAMAADYRVASRHGVKPTSCVADAKSAVRWIRRNYRKLGVDPERIVAAGGSAGGHIAACTGTVEDFDEQGENAKISARPNAMILFNPAVVLAPVDGKEPLRDAAKLRERIGTEPEQISPYHHVKAGVPPTLIFHGTADMTVPYRTAEWFTQAMLEAGNRCELAGYDGQKHGFFNFGRDGNKNFVETLTRADRFLVSLGYLEGEPRVAAFLAESKER